jgi:gamma-glutamyl-gamma-aminobutyraldehyde dehydrogenase
MATAPTLEYWSDKARATLPETRAFIGGAYVDAADGATMPCVSPIDGRRLADIAACGSKDVDQAVRVARGAFERGVWASLAPRKRKSVLLRFARLIADHAEELALLETLDMGKPISLSVGDDLPAVVNTVQWYAECVDKVYDEIAPTPADALGLITREPLGVVAAVVPWNFRC